MYQKYINSVICLRFFSLKMCFVWVLDYFFLCSYFQPTTLNRKPKLKKNKSSEENKSSRFTREERLQSSEACFPSLNPSLGCAGTAACPQPPPWRCPPRSRAMPQPHNAHAHILLSTSPLDSPVHPWSFPILKPLPSLILSLDLLLSFIPHFVASSLCSVVILTGLQLP